MKLFQERRFFKGILRESIIEQPEGNMQPSNLTREQILNGNELDELRRTGIKDGTEESLPNQEETK